MADETTDTVTAAEAAAAALQAVSNTGMTEEEAKDDAKALKLGKQKRDAELARKKAVADELHVASDLMAAATRLYGVPPEVVAGAMHNAGLEMTDELTIGDLETHIKSFMDQPA